MRQTTLETLDDARAARRASRHRRARPIALAAAALLAVAGVAGAEPIPAAAYQALRWRSIGPFRGGRTRAVAGVASQPGVFYIGQVNGGVWKTDDFGRTWRPIFDDQPTQSIGAIAVAPSNPNVIYVGSGEGLHRPDLSVGDGIYKSTDAGKTWRHLGLHDAQQVPQIAIDPRNPDRVYAAVLGHPYGASEERGVYRSTDGGKTWQRVLYHDASTGASDIAIDPKHPDVVYAGLWESRLGPAEDGNEFRGPGGGLYKSTDGGTTWHQLKAGLPDHPIQFNIGIAPSQPSRIYLSLAAEPRDGGRGTAIYRSDDSGASWTRLTGADERPTGRVGGSELMVPVVDPKNPDQVYVTSTVAMKTSDGGKTWTWLRGAPGGDDYQNLWINPNDPRIIALVSDQGAVITVNGGQTWSSWYNQPTAQLYHVAATADFPYRVCSGQQESGSVCVASRGNDGAIGMREWHPVGVIEYGYAAPDPRNPDFLYGAGRNEVTRYQWSTGRVQNITPIPIRGSYRFERTQPIMFSPLRPGVLYYAANVLFESTDNGQTWRTISPDLSHPHPGVPPSVASLAASNPAAADQRGAIYALALSFKSPSTFWAGTDDGKLWTTRDGGKNWTDITPPQVTPWSKVTQLEAGHFDDTTAYASVSRFRVDDLTPYIYRTHDAGKTWTLITAGLPPGPVDAVREDPARKGLLYAATENAVWMSFDDGASWQSLQRNLPHTAARDIIVHGSDLIVATHGRGFWIMDDITPLRQLAATMPDTLFKPAAAIRVPHSLNTDTPIPPDEPMAENPPTGAVIDYYLAAPASGAVTLEIVDARGKPVRRFASTDPPDPSPDELARQLIPAYWVRPHQALGTTAGGHRWVWDLRGERPAALSYEYPISAVPYDTTREPEGPMVVPGTYTVKLTVNGKTLSAPLEVKLDPRLKLSPAAVAQQSQRAVQLAELLTRSTQLVRQARSVAAQLGKLNAPDPLKGQIAAAAAKVTGAMGARGGRGAPAADRDRGPTLMSVNGKLGTLYRLVDVDAAPTAVAVAEIAKAERELAQVTASWTAVKAELATLSTALTGAGLPAVQPDLAAGRDGDGQQNEDEE